MRTPMTNERQVVGVLQNPRTEAITLRFIRELERHGVSWMVVNLKTASSDPAIRGESGEFSISHLTPGATYGEPGGVSLMSAMAESGVAMLNTPSSCIMADDKILTAEALDKHGVPQPKWGVVSSACLTHESFPDYPFVLKRPDGALGVWNRLVTSPAHLEQNAKELLAEGASDLMIQEAVMESLGRSVRAVVLDDKVLASTELVATEGEWRSNGFLGGTGHDCPLDDEETEIVVSACRALGLRYAGVDLLRSKRGPLILELNCGSPFDGAERRTGRNIAALILKALLG